ncbi:plasmid partitioning protein RepA [Methylobacterium sp. 092160098-2]|uniref:plasmid partitioning protein RepA n=1 Tax=Methylobacterium sp. 092160098-2 TaxID=3025129 RepID=UPI002381A70B|nr:plasmid partitioning protein RepA [Methylobacterium sp. 092160098-2]MDE4914991.1 plasmid partitioning protein RepA [Methylobacterium sp. 092160098-2]
MDTLPSRTADQEHATEVALEGEASTGSASPAVPHASSTTRETQTLDALLGGQAQKLTARLKLLRQKMYPPDAAKTLRTFSSPEAASFIGVDPSYLRKLDLDGRMPRPATDNLGRRSFTVREMNEIRTLLDQNGKDGRRYVRHRTPGEHLQVICVTNFKGGSGKTTTASHLAQYLALRGYRVLGLDLDPQASFTALHGLQPELDVAENASLHSAIRYGTQRRPMAELVRKTYFEGLDLVPGNIDIQDFEHEVPKDLMARQSGRNTGETQFYLRLQKAIREVENDYDVVVIDCPPQMGYLTMAALSAATSLLITVHPAMVDVMSMAQFLLMTSDYMRIVAERGVKLNLDFSRYLVTRYEPGDAPQNDMLNLMRTMFGDHVMKNPMLKTTAVADANLTKQTIFEVPREKFTRSTYDRAMESLLAVNSEIEGLINAAWGRN